MRKLILIQVLLVLMVCSSCVMFEDKQDVIFTLPFESQWNVRVSDGSSFYVDGDCFHCSIRKNNATGLVASCSACDENPGITVGAIYPVNMELSENNAFPAQVLYSIAMSSTDSAPHIDYCLSTFNWKKFEEVCSEFGEEIWRVDRESVMKKIARGTFKKSDLKVE